jgi:thymidylate synthase (FAD)
MSKAILVSKTAVDPVYVESLTDFEEPQDIQQLEFMRKIKRDPEQLMIYIARVSSPNQINPSYEKLLKYCWEHGHFSVFEQISCTVEVETDLNVAAQLLRHRSFVFQQLSRRYSSQKPEFVILEARGQDLKNRQNSLDNLTDHQKLEFLAMQSNIISQAAKYYEKAIDMGIAKEVARYILPTSTKTKLYVTGTLRSFIHYVNVRSDVSSQLEHRDLAIAIKDQLCYHFPITAKAVWDKEVL